MTENTGKETSVVQNPNEIHKGWVAATATAAAGALIPGAQTATGLFEKSVSNLNTVVQNIDRADLAITIPTPETATDVFEKTIALVVETFSPNNEAELVVSTVAYFALYGAAAYSFLKSTPYIEAKARELINRK